MAEYYGLFCIRSRFNTIHVVVLKCKRTQTEGKWMQMWKNQTEVKESKRNIANGSQKICKQMLNGKLKMIR